MCKVLLSAKNESNLLKAKETLLKDGWLCDHEKDQLVLKHEKVRTQKEARERLYSAGLLLSSAVYLQIL